ERARVGTATAHGSEEHHGAVISFASAAPPSRFVGYEKLRAETSLLAAQPDAARVLIKLEESPFYAEGGGQVADSGEIRWQGGSGCSRAGRGRGGRARQPDRRPGRGRGGRGRGRPRAPLPHDAKPHRHSPAARGPPRAARDSRPPGGLGGSPRQAAVRLHTRR